MLENSFPLRVCTLPHPQTSVVAQFPGLLRGESPSCHNSGAYLHVLYAEFLPAGNVSGTYKSCWQCPGRQLEWEHTLIQLCSPPSWLAVRDRAFLILVPSYFSSASHDCLTFVPSNPTPIPPQNLEMDWIFLLRTWDSSKPIQPP